MHPSCDHSTEPPFDCLRVIHKKIDGLSLNKKDFKTIINAVYCRRLADVQIAAFLTACATNKLSESETVYLTQVMIDAGRKLYWKRKIVVDKHCVGGVAGNRVTPILVSIVAAAGLVIPKTSSKAITSPAGTADTMNVLTNVTLSSDQIHEIVNKTGGCFAWGGHTDISPVDDLLIQVERKLDLDYNSQMIASILSKKVAAGATHVLIDIPVGKDIKVKTRKQALRLKSLFEVVGKAFGLKIHVMLSNGNEPVGHGIGPVLEAIDVLQVLRNESAAPQDLKDKVCRIANILFKMAKVKKDAYEILSSGQAWIKFQEICKAQGGLKQGIPSASFQYTIYATESKKIHIIKNKDIVEMAKLAGAPNHPEAGVYLHVHVGDNVKKGAPLITIHARTKENLKQALDYASKSTMWNGSHRRQTE